MKLQERDFTKLHKAERKAFESILQREVAGTEETKIWGRQCLYHEYPKAARHFTSLFPNNFLDERELQEEQERSRKRVGEFERLLNSKGITERRILNFIGKSGAYFLIGGLLKEYFRFGHHGAFLFPEFQLGNSFKVDYLLVGGNSGGWHFVFVELEAPVGKIRLKNGKLGDAFRRGQSQTNDWVRWLEAHFSSIAESFQKATRLATALPQEFLQYDSTRMHFVVVAGRRSDFTTHTYEECRRQTQTLIHYDNLVDAGAAAIGSLTY